MIAPERIEIEASDMTFGALAWGNPVAPLAFLVHGYPDTAWTWRHLGPLLAERGWRAVAPFTRGYAPSDLAPMTAFSSPTKSTTSWLYTRRSAATPARRSWGTTGVPSLPGA